MNILVTGVNGQLGFDVVNELIKRNHKPIRITRENLDLEIIDKIYETLKTITMDGIIHCAAYTNVDKAEDEKEVAFAINAEATKEIAKVAKEKNIPMIYISTDYIFDGEKKKEYKEEDIPSPINVYGLSKLLGEDFIRETLSKYYIVRISWVFGVNGNNFVNKMIGLSKEKSSLNIIDDQIGSPTYTKDLSRLLVDMIETNKYGIYNATNSGYCSWYEFAKEIFKKLNITININPICSDDYLTKAKRPLNSKLSKEKLIRNGFEPLRHWTFALNEYLSNKESR